MLVKCSAEDCINNRLGMCCKEAIELSKHMSSRILVTCESYKEEK